MKGSGAMHSYIPSSYYVSIVAYSRDTSERIANCWQVINYVCIEEGKTMKGSGAICSYTPSSY